MGPRQIIIDLPNTPGQLSDISELLGENGINIKAVCISPKGDLGELSLVLDDHDRGKLVLEGNGYMVRETPVIAAYGPDHPGGLNAVMRPLKEQGINVDKLYLSAARKGENALIIIEVSDYEKAAAALRANYVEIVIGEFKF